MGSQGVLSGFSWVLMSTHGFSVGSQWVLMCSHGFSVGTQIVHFGVLRGVLRQAPPILALQLSGPNWQSAQATHDVDAAHH